MAGSISPADAVEGNNRVLAAAAMVQVLINSSRVMAAGRTVVSFAGAMSDGRKAEAAETSKSKVVHRAVTYRSMLFLIVNVVVENASNHFLDNAMGSKAAGKVGRKSAYA
jgi:hypothetical protein